MKELFCVIIFLIFMTTTVFSQNFWQQTNGPYGGRIMAISVNSNGDIFAGCEEDGTFALPLIFI